MTYGEVSMKYAWLPTKIGNRWHWMTRIYHQGNLYFGWEGYEYWEVREGSGPWPNSIEEE